MSGERSPFRWRFVPATILILFGGLGVVSSLGWIAAQWFAAEVTVARVCGNILTAAAGAVWFAAGLLIQKGKWWRSGLGLLIGYALGVLGGYLAFPERF